MESIPGMNTPGTTTEEESGYSSSSSFGSSDEESEEIYAEANEEHDRFEGLIEQLEEEIFAGNIEFGHALLREVLITRQKRQFVFERVVQHSCLVTKFFLDTDGTLDSSRALRALCSCREGSLDNRETAILLLNYGADPNAYHGLLLQTCARWGDAELFDRAVRLGADQVFAFGPTPLAECLKHNCKDIVQVMIQNDRRARAMLALRQVCGESRARKHLFLEAFDLIYDYAGIQLDDPAARVALILNFDDEIRSIQSEKDLKEQLRFFGH